MRTFIYSFSSTCSSLVYIGQTTRPALREKQHRTMLRRGTHPNRILLREFRAHGDCFRFEILQECAQEPAHVCEQAWIDRMTETKDVANLRPATVPVALGRKHSPETRKKMSDTHKRMGRQPWHVLTTERSKEINAKRKQPTAADTQRLRANAYLGLAERTRRPVINIDTGFIYYSGREAAKQIGAHPSSVNDACRGKLARLKGHRWRYLDEVKH